MIDIHEIIRRSRAGDSARKIARETQIDRKTVARYLAAADLVLATPQVELTDELIRSIKNEVQSREEGEPTSAQALLHKHRDRIRTWLNDAKQPLRLIRIHELLMREGVEVGYTTLRRFARDECGFGQQPTTVLVADAGPGEEAQVDFGLMGKVNFEGVERKLWVFIVTLVYSRYSFIWPTFTQKSSDVIEALEAAWRHFGGICRRVIPDNATSIIVQADPLKPVVGRIMLEYSQRRGFFIDAARVEHPQDKSRVENHVPYTRERWFAGETFVSVEQAREHSQAWCRDVAGMRLHGTTRKRPYEVFEALERPQLAPPPTDFYEVPRWQDATVQRDHHFRVDNALYSASTAHIGHKVNVRITASMIVAYRDGEVVATHERTEPGGRRTHPDHYPQHKRAYAMRDVEGLIEGAKEHGNEVEAFARKLLSGDFAWTKMRQATALLSLCERYGSARIDHACASAISYDVYDVQRLGDRVKSAHKLENRAIESGKMVALPGRFARSKEGFATINPAASNEEAGGES